jgi:hypothetical protein
MSPPVYASDPDAAPDSEFVSGALRHLAPGNRGRLCDARRTPITITSIDLDRGAFQLEIGAFADAGARWDLPLEEVARFQFAADAQIVDGVDVARLEQAVERFDRELSRRRCQGWSRWRTSREGRPLKPPSFGASAFRLRDC